MSTPGGRPENLIPADKRTEEELREMTRNGGIKSGEVRREKKRMADIYAAVLAREFEVKAKGGEKVTKTGADLVEDVIVSIVRRRNSSSVSMIKEMREGIDGSKVEHSGSFDLSMLTNDELDAKIAEFVTENAERLTKK